MSKVTTSGDMNAKVMSGAELMDATTTVVRTISRKAGTDVKFAGEGACTDGDTVILPALDQQADVTRRQALVLGGFANHETLHNLMTDFGRLKRKVKKWHDEGKTLTKALANAIEDVRIEHGGTQLYAGMGKAIDQTAREVTRKFIDEVYPQDTSVVEDFGKIGPVAVTWEGRRRLGYEDKANEEALALLPKKIRKQVDKIVDATMALDHGVTGLGEINRQVALDGSLDAAKLAERVANKYMRDREKEQEKQRQQEQEQGNEQGKGGSTQGEEQADQGETSQGSGGGDNTETGMDAGGSAQGGEDQVEAQAETYTNDGSEPKREESGEDGSKGATGAESGQVDGQPEPISPDLDGVIDSLVAEINSQTQSSGSYRVYAPSGDIVQTQGDVITSQSSKRHYSKRYNDVKGQMSSQLGTTRRKLERVMTAMSQGGWENGRRSGKLDVRRNGAKIVQYQPNVFRRREDEVTVDAALSLLIDLSGSMNGPKLELSQKAVIAIAEALEPVGVPLEVSGHNTWVSPELEKQYVNKHERPSGELFDRVHNIKTTIIKRFEDSLQTAKPMMGVIDMLAGGGNADGDAILMAAKRLLERREKRKILFVLSDGSPAYMTERTDEHQRTRDCIEWCITQGIEIVGLGILDTSVKNYYPAFTVVQDLKSFANVTVSEVADLLQGRGQLHKDLMSTDVRRGKRFA